MKMRDTFFFVLLILFANFRGKTAFYGCKDIESQSPVLQLKEYLFCKYERNVRPTLDHRNATVVHFGLEITTFDVNDFTNIIDVYVWTKLTWIDSHLTWKPSSYNDITSLHVMSDEIWVPDIISHSATDLDVEVEMPSTDCWLYNNGRVLCAPTTMYTAHCESDHSWWPYDMMNCTLHFASWSHSEDEIDLRLINIEIDGQLTAEVYQKNKEWDMIKISTSKRIVRSKFDVYFVSNMLSFSMQLKRHSSMYSTAYVTLAMVLMTMTLMAVWLEPRSSERMIIANLNFILHLVCLQDLQWKVPYNGRQPPKLLLFYENSLVLATFSLVLTSILRHVQELNAEAPAWISSGTETILKSKVGQILLVSILDPKASARMEINSDDNTNLVSSERKVSTTWGYTTILISWLTFFSVLFVYLIMLAVLMPTSTSSVQL